MSVGIGHETSGKRGNASRKPNGGTSPNRLAGSMALSRSGHSMLCAGGCSDARFLGGRLRGFDGGRTASSYALGRLSSETLFDDVLRSRCDIVHRGQEFTAVSFHGPPARLGLYFVRRHHAWNRFCRGHAHHLDVDRILGNRDQRNSYGVVRAA
jgi:hypothetical protein